ncbi:MAG: T9SS type A sorting domain-containing protein [Crocinitomicaceae bacterium]
MKKIILSLLTVCTGLTAMSQTAFTYTNEPVIGDSRTLFVCDSMAPDYASTTGNGVVWNYGLTPTYSGQTRLLEVLDASTTPYAADFVGATKTVSIESFASTYFSSDAMGRSSQGFYIETTGFGTVKAIYDGDNEKVMNYPMNLNDQVVDLFSGSLSFTFTVPQNPACAGSAKAVYDGYGTLVQVNNISVSNVARYHIVDTTSADIMFVGNTNIIRNQYEYYDLSSSNKTPIFIYANIKIVSGFTTPLADMSIVLSAVDGNGMAGLEDQSADAFTVYPNPTTGNLCLTNVSPSAKITLTDMSGRIFNVDRTSSNQVDISTLAKGVYTATISQDGTVQQTRIVLQ